MRKISTNLKQIRHLLTAIVFLTFAASMAAQTTIMLEDFEDNTLEYIPSFIDCNDGGGDFYIRTDGTDLPGSYSITGVQGTSFYAAMDTDGCSANPQAPIDLNFSGIDVTGNTMMEFCIYLAEDDDGGNQDWDAADFFHVSYQVDGGGFMDLLWIESELPSGSTFNGVPKVDTDFDGEGDGQEITSTMTQICVDVPGTGMLMDINIQFDLDSGDEDIAFDNVELREKAAMPCDLTITGTVIVNPLCSPGTGDITVTATTSNPAIVYNLMSGGATVASNGTGVFTGFAEGDYTVMVTDAMAGCSDAVPATIAATDDVDPMAVCMDATVELDANGMVTVIPADVEGGSTDNCGIVNSTVSPNMFDCNTITGGGVVPTGDLVISAVFDGPLSGGTPKGVELFVVNDIPDLSVYGISSANNGGGTTGTPEFTFPADAYSAGDYIYVSSETPMFAAFFGMATTYDVGFTMGINGDDAIELFENGVVVDVFGDVNVDGSGTPWEYQDGWAYRVNSTGPDGSTFNIANWTFSGVNGLEGGTTNSTAMVSMPIGTYLFPLGTGMADVTLTVTDAAGNTGDCTATITVEDNLAPVANCIPAVTLDLDADGNAIVTPADIDAGSTDNCAIASSAVSPNMVDCSNVDGITVTLTVTDIDGNTGTCTSMVSTADITPPVAICASAIVNLNAAGTGRVNANRVDGGSFDNCGTITRSVSANSFSCADIQLLTPTSTLIISGVVDGDQPGGLPKAIEFYALQDIPDLSIYGFGSANNGGGSDGEEFTFPADAVTAGTFIYLAFEPNEFTSFFGFAPDYLSGAASINGDDAIELFENGAVIDVFGDINVNGDNEAWDYTDSWAYRVNATEADGTFSVGNYIYGGRNALMDETSNATAAVPFPIGSYTFPIAGGMSTVTLTVTDDEGLTSTCDANVLILDRRRPTAVCQAGFITLDANGVAAIDAASLDGGSTDNCAVTSFATDPAEATCDMVGVVSVVLTASDLSGNTDDCDATLEVTASLACTPPNISNEGGPNIADPCTCRGNGEFDEEVVIGPAGAGQEWVISSTDLIDPATGNTFSVGTPLTEMPDPNNPGRFIYTIAGVHLDGVGYTLEATSRFYPGQPLSISNTCFYPEPQITLPLGGFCLNTPPQTFTGFEAAGVEGSGQFFFDGDRVRTTDAGGGNWEATINIANKGIGVYTLRFEFDAGDPAGLLSPTDVGCVSFVEEVIKIVETPDVVACNDIQVSLDENCEAEIFPDMILEGTYFCYDDYEVTLTTAAGGNVRNPITSAYAGQVITTKVTHLISGNSCWGTVTVEDKLGPKFICSVDYRDKMGVIIETGDLFNLTCDVDPSVISAPIALDNCEGPRAGFLISETTTGDACDVLTIVRVYGSEDSNGNPGDNCTITIKVEQPTVTFPDDITWTCEQYAAYGNIVDPTELNILIDPVTACDLDPNWDDDRNNCNDTRERDTDECKANFAGTYIDCVDDSGHVPVVTQSPVHDASLLNGLEDADVLELTGSGVPNVYGLDKSGCKFSVTWKDQKLEACDGVDTTITFKIIRTWTVLNWCTGIVSTDVQVIKVLDKDAPVITFADDFETDIKADQYSSAGAHADCGAQGPIGVPDFADNCSGVDMTSVRLYTPVGEGIPQYDGAGNLRGFTFPAPYLPVGIHTVTYEVSDNCGNKATATQVIRIIDGIPPVPVCREFTQVALSGGTDGIIEVHATSFDEASYDNCSPVYFLVRKMDRDDNCPGFTSEHSTFTPSIHFCCDNIGDTVNVILKVYDRDPGTRQSLTGLADNSNECMIRVLTEDKTRPECHAPADVWINCDEVADNLDLSDITALAAKFGDATSTDNCGSSVEELTPDVDMDLCGVGTVVRNWRATDNYGNRHVGRCQQTIMIMAQNNYKINLPGDFEEECDDASPADLTYVENACDLLAVNLEEQDFPASPLGECKKVIRTWRVINWCEYDGFSAPTRLPRLDLNGDGVIGDGMMGSENTVTGNNLRSMHMYTSNGNRMVLNDGPDAVASTGYYEYIQHVKIFDNTAPDVSYDGDVEFCGGDRDEDPCTGVVNLPINASDLCTNVSVTWELTAFSDSFTAANFSGNGTFSGRYPLGTHTVRYYVEDECRNISQLDITFTIIDCKAPTPVCYNGLSVSLMPTGMVSVWASDFDASSFDYCHPFNLTVNVVEDSNGDGFIDSNDYLTTSPSGTEVMLDCNHVGAITYVQLWVNEESNDDVNNSDYCVTFIEVQDNLDVCAASKVALGGNIKNESGESVQDVMVEVNNGMSMMTSSDGAFNFNVPVAGDYTVTPMRNDEVDNGVSTFDLLQISKHILNTQKLDSPYKMIAADANRSGNISTIDLISIRKVILKVATEFPNNTSWRFVDADYIFADANNALRENFKEIINRNNLTSADLSANFVAIKVGDVNGDATPNSVLGVDGRTFNGSLNFKATDKDVKAGEEFTVSFTAAQEVAGYQFTMTFDEKSVDLISIENGLTTDNNFNVIGNQIATSWNESASTKDVEMFSLTFSAKADLKASEVLTIGSAVTAAEAYDAAGNLMNVGLDFGTGAQASTFELLQNVPNPFATTTVIGFTLPEAAVATMTISDVSGKVLRVISGDYSKGYNEVKLEMTNDLPQGVLVYELATPTHKATRKMTAIK